MIVKLLGFVLILFFNILNVNGETESSCVQQTLYCEQICERISKPPEAVLESPAKILFKLKQAYKTLIYRHGHDVSHIKDIQNVHQQFTKILDTSEIIFENIGASRIVLSENKFTPGHTEFPSKKEEVMKALNNTLEYTVYFALLVSQVPFPTCIIARQYLDWEDLFTWGRETTQALNILDHDIKELFRGAIINLQLRKKTRGVPKLSPKNPMPPIIGRRWATNTKVNSQAVRNLNYELQRRYISMEQDIDNFKHLKDNYFTLLRTSSLIFQQVNVTISQLKKVHYVPGITTYPLNTKDDSRAFSRTMIASIFYAKLIRAFPDLICKMLFAYKEWKELYTWAYNAALKSNVLEKNMEKLIANAYLDLYLLHHENVRIYKNTEASRRYGGTIIQAALKMESEKKMKEFLTNTKL